jgi:hypothetical protein
MCSKKVAGCLLPVTGMRPTLLWYSHGLSIFISFRENITVRGVTGNR